MSLPNAFLTRPIAHRGLHNSSRGIVENSLGAFREAIDAGYPIELDVQLSHDGDAMVFHDYDLRRLTNHNGPVRQHKAANLKEITLKNSSDTINTLPEILSEIEGRVPVIIELKDQDGAMGNDLGPLEHSVATAVQAYHGDVAVMSFNPHSVSRLAALLPDIPRGIVTSDFNPADWPLSQNTCAILRKIPDFDRVKAQFISHDVTDLNAPRVAEIKQTGASVLCWTVRSEAVAREALKIADNITFEGYLPG
ncbi:glycerophosphodiester phosphodiesterase family protein [Litoreibacter roseus]|uniref:Phosphodiesterase n=1 Tax=Litoreibacter roseus TaxID=2601869 RepID=A0A6N6JEI7_9RHOB|nr:glycerophosphodiester phosphodiesterase family protein [Litoreibacter roseus]GFE64761.1 phosphodiesterase [Litoreibacter roseus]